MSLSTDYGAMDEKTEELREIFTRVTNEESVTESQAEQRGSLTGDAAGDEVDEIVREMRDQFEFETDLSVEQLCQVVERFYDGDSDEEIAATLDRTPETVFAARMDLLLLRDDDPDGVDLGALQERLDGDEGVDAVAEDLEVDPADLRRAKRFLRARDRARRTSYRYQTAFEERLTDADISEQLAAGAREDGLGEAAEDIETDLDF
jgi:hypothetical protein